MFIACLQLSTNTNATLLYFYSMFTTVYVQATLKRYCCFDIYSCNEFSKYLWDMFFVIMKDDPAFKKRLYQYCTC